MEPNSESKTEPSDSDVFLSFVFLLLFLVSLTFVGTMDRAEIVKWEATAEPCPPAPMLEICMNGWLLGIYDSQIWKIGSIGLVSIGAVWYGTCFVGFVVWLDKKYKRFRGKSEEILRK